MRALNMKCMTPAGQASSILHHQSASSSHRPANGSTSSSSSYAAGCSYAPRCWSSSGSCTIRARGTSTASRCFDNADQDAHQVQPQVLRKARLLTSFDQLEDRQDDELVEELVALPTVPGKIRIVLPLDEVEPEHELVEEYEMNNPTQQALDRIFIACKAMGFISLASMEVPPNRTFNVLRWIKELQPGGRYLVLRVTSRPIDNQLEILRRQTSRS